jgi:hypothetical protein
MSTNAGWHSTDWKWVCTAALVALLLNLVPPTARAEPNMVTCSLQKGDEVFSGSCSIPCAVNDLAIDIDGVNPRRACDRPVRVVQASLKPIPGGNWLGTMQGKEPEDPKRFELTKGKDGALDVAKLPYGWFRLAESKLEGNRLSLIIVANRTLPPTTDDIRIIQRTLQLLSDVKVWNKEDNRKCPQNPSKWSLFCALTQATTEISGGVHYRQPALQAVREVLNEVDGSRVRLHRLMEYNNDPDTTLEDIHNLLKISQQRLEKRVLATN